MVVVEHEVVEPTYFGLLSHARMFMATMGIFSSAVMSAFMEPIVAIRLMHYDLT